jgi:hypothetical protein
MINSLRLTIVVALSSLALSALAQTSASATIAEVGHSGSNYEYSIDLTNTGSTGIETYWYSWVPGQNYLPSTPSNFTEPGGWNAPTVTGGGNSTDGKAIRWESSTGLAAGDSATFTFWIADAPSVIFGNSPFHGGPPIGTSFVYSGIFPSGTSHEFVTQPVPGPSSALALVGGLIGFARRRRKG